MNMPMSLARSLSTCQQMLGLCRHGCNCW